MNELISICIPAYNRPELLAEALESCALQNYSPLEIVIGDDSTNADSEAVAEKYRGVRSWTMSYHRNAPGLGQNGNVNEMFDRAAGDRVVLLHDDDKLLPGAVAALASAWNSRPTLQVAFGRQAIISSKGVRDEAESLKLNEEFARTGPSRILPDAITSALLQQFPNDGYMIRRDLATTVRYRSKAEIGNHCDVEFALRVCADLPNDAVYYIDSLLAEYRRHDQSISQSADNRRPPNPAAGRGLFETIGSLRLDRTQEFARRKIYSRFIDRVLKGFALNGKRGEALRLFCSNKYGWRRRVSAKGAYHLALIMLPAIEKVRRYDS
jgi:glycosyltransferase involved in cell wall biosynthesis